MATINFVTKSLTTSNRTRIKLFKEPDRITVIDSLIHNAPHPQEIWSFFNIVPGDNYFFTWSEIDGSGNDIQVYASATITTSANSIEVRPAENITVDVTPNVVSGATTALFDGSNGSPDYRTWKPVFFLDGVGPMHEGTDYSWNATTGLLSLMNGATFIGGGNRIFVSFEPKTTNVAPPPVTRKAWSTDLIITDDITLSTTDVNKNALILGLDSYLKITLPDITATPVGDPFYFECPPDSTTKCAEITCNAAAGNSNKIMWPKPNKGSLFICNSESLAIYRQVISGVNYWRVKFAEGGFKNVGEFVGEYSASDVINKVEATNATYNNLDYARLYDYILNLDASEVVTFVGWASSKTKFSFADGSGDFHVPDLRNLYERASGNNASGSYLNNTVGPHSHPLKYVMNGTDGTANGQQIDPSIAPVENNPKGTNTYAIESNNVGGETRPETYVAHKYIRC